MKEHASTHIHNSNIDILQLLRFYVVVHTVQCQSGGQLCSLQFIQLGAKMKKKLALAAHQPGLA